MECYSLVALCDRDRARTRLKATLHLVIAYPVHALRAYKKQRSYLHAGNEPKFPRIQNTEMI